MLLTHLEVEFNTKRQDSALFHRDPISLNRVNSTERMVAALDHDAKMAHNRGRHLPHGHGRVRTRRERQARRAHLVRFDLHMTFSRFKIYKHRCSSVTQNDATFAHMAGVTCG